MEINQYPLESLTFQDNDFYDIDFYTGSGYQTKKILGSVIKAGILSGVVSTNIYNSDGSIDSDRTLTLDGGSLTFQNPQGSTQFSGRRISVNAGVSNDAKLSLGCPLNYETAIELSSEGYSRWKIKTQGNEIGGDTGSNLVFESFDDNGVTNGDALKIDRANRTIRIADSYTMPSSSNLIGNQVITDDGAGNLSFQSLPFEIQIAASNETSNISTGSAKVTFRIPRAIELTSVRASLSIAQAVGLPVTIDINNNSVSILSTKLSIDNNEKTSTTASIPAVISAPTLADDDEITIDIDQIGTPLAKGLKITLLGYRL